MEQHPLKKATGISIIGKKVKEIFREVEGHRGLWMTQCSDGTIQGPKVREVRKMDQVQGGTEALGIRKDLGDSSFFD